MSEVVLELSAVQLDVSGIAHRREELFELGVHLMLEQKIIND